MTDETKKRPDDCSYPKHCGWNGHGCKNLLCKHLSREAAREALFFLRQPKK